MPAPFKVFGIGLSRTGTTSLNAALELLGFRAMHYPDPEPMLRGDLSVAHEYDALTDLPVAVFFRPLDLLFPGSRFILTVRDEASWLGSIRKHFEAMGSALEHGPPAELRRRAYGSTLFDEDLFRRARAAHERAVREHFRGRSGDVLEMNIADGQGWEVLCPFLGMPLPEAAFPRLNAQGTQPRAAPPIDRRWYTGPRPR